MSYTVASFGLVFSAMVFPSGDGRGERNLFAAGRPRRAGNAPREIEIINGNGARVWIGRRCDCLWIADLARIRARRLGNRGTANQESQESQESQERKTGTS